MFIQTSTDTYIAVDTIARFTTSVSSSETLELTLFTKRGELFAIKAPYADAALTLLTKP